MTSVDQCTGLLLALIAQDLNLVVQNLDALLHLSEVLAESLDFSNVAIAAVFDLLEQSNERV